MGVILLTLFVLFSISSPLKEKTYSQEFRAEFLSRLERFEKLNGKYTTLALILDERLEEFEKKQFLGTFFSQARYLHAKDKEYLMKLQKVSTVKELIDTVLTFERRKCTDVTAPELCAPALLAMLYGVADFEFCKVWVSPQSCSAFTDQCFDRTKQAVSVLLRAPLESPACSLTAESLLS